MILNRRFCIAITLLFTASITQSCVGRLFSTHPTIKIGSKEFTEQYLLGHMFEIALDNAGYAADYQSVGSSEENHNALVSGEIDLYPEYTGTAFIVHLKQTYKSTMSAADVYEKVASEYAKQFNIVLLAPASFNNTYALVMRKDKAQKLNVATISELSDKTDKLTLGTDLEFLDRNDGLSALQEFYGGLNFEKVKSLTPDLLYTGLDSGDFDVTTGYTTDGQISALDLLVLEDNKQFWPPYRVAPFIRQEVIDTNPEITNVINSVTSLLDDKTMSVLNWEVAGNGRDPEEVARDFLEEQGIL